VRIPIEAVFGEGQVRQWIIAWRALIVPMVFAIGLMSSCSTSAWSGDLALFLSNKSRLSSAPARSNPTGSSGELKTSQFDIAYVEPKNPAHRPIFEMLKEEQILEKVQALLAPVKLPLRITLKLEGCDGIANATFWEDAIIVCYEYIEYAWNHARLTAASDFSPRDARIGSTVEVFLHEAGHAVLEVLDIPFFGREEEVADYFATYILLQLCKDDARRLILGASFVNGREAAEEQGKVPEPRLLAATHSLPAQRFFNRWCMAYGANPVLFADAISDGMLPQSRAKHCRYEYQTNAFAFNTLIRPYIDEEMKQKVLAARWFATPAMGEACSEAVSALSDPAPTSRPGTAPPGIRSEAASQTRP
jgi:hypothetical protein